ncbi:MAG: DUF6356 family protein [Bacteroidales bacterium]
MKNSNIFTRHPNEVRMSYFEHTRFALMLSRTTLVCSVCSLVHAFFPFLFVTHTSTAIRKMQDIFDQREKELTNPNTKQHGNKSNTESNI